MLSLRPTRSQAFHHSSAEFFLVPASPYPPSPTLQHHHHQQHHHAMFANPFQQQLANPLLHPLHHAQYQQQQPNYSRHRANLYPQHKPLTIIFDLRPEFLPPHLTIPSPLTCSWFMRFLRAREADGVCDVPGVRSGRMVVRVADAETRDWVERGRCHIKGVDGGEWGSVVVGDGAIQL